MRTKIPTFISFYVWSGYGLRKMQKELFWVEVVGLVLSLGDFDRFKCFNFLQIRYFPLQHFDIFLIFVTLKSKYWKAKIGGNETDDDVRRQTGRCSKSKRFLGLDSEEYGSALLSCKVGFVCAKPH